MPLVYSPSRFDLAGFAVGVVARDRLITGENIRAGQVVLGLASNGLHANGFTLVQRVLSRSRLASLAGELLKPTRIYVRSVLKLLEKRVPVAGIAHITGGSFSEKIPRILPAGVKVVLRKSAWKVPVIFRTLQAAGVPESEMYRTFNMGIGMALLLPRAAASKAQRILGLQGVASWIIGEVARGDRAVEMTKGL